MIVTVSRDDGVLVVEGIVASVCVSWAGWIGSSVDILSFDSAGDPRDPSWSAATEGSEVDKTSSGAEVALEVRTSVCSVTGGKDEMPLDDSDLVPMSADDVELPDSWLDSVELGSSAALGCAVELDGTIASGDRVVGLTSGAAGTVVI